MKQLKKHNQSPKSPSQRNDRPANQLVGQQSNRRRLTLLAIVALVALAIFLGLKYVQANNKAKNLAANPQAATSAALKKVTNEVGKLVILPTNETPTLATVSDAAKLVNQPFFAKAQDGDKVLIYAQARIAILYRPSINKIVNIAPLNIGSQNNG